MLVLFLTFPPKFKYKAKNSAARIASKSPLRLGATLPKGIGDIVSPNMSMRTPVNDSARPAKAKREGVSLKTRVEMSIEKNGTVFTNTVEFKIVVSFTETVKKIK